MIIPYLLIFQDGDYNKPIILNNGQLKMTPKVFQKTSPKNGLCKMCNINQQLKVTQLANFVPMNENNFEQEIETYRYICNPYIFNLNILIYKREK